MRDLFKLNIHSKRFLNFIQNFKHSNNETLNHSSNSSHNNNNNRENSSNKSAGLSKDSKNLENETNVTNNNNSEEKNISKELNNNAKGGENETKMEKDQNLSKIGGIQEKNETNSTEGKPNSSENDKIDETIAIKNKEFEEKQKLSAKKEIVDVSNQKITLNSLPGEEKDTTKNINSASFLKVI